MNGQPPNLAAAFRDLSTISRQAMSDYAARCPDCSAAQVGLALTRGADPDAVASLIRVLPPARRRQLFDDARRQQRSAANRNADRLAAFYGALVSLADRKQSPPQN